MRNSICLKNQTAAKRRPANGNCTSVFSTIRSAWARVYNSFRRSQVSIARTEPDTIWDAVESVFNKAFWPFIIFTVCYIGGHVLFALITGAI
jgi:hypothetical protein